MYRGWEGERRSPHEMRGLRVPASVGILVLLRSPLILFYVHVIKRVCLCVCVTAPLSVPASQHG